MFVKTDISKAFSAADISKDTFLKKEALISKLGEMIVKDKVDLEKLLVSRKVVLTGKETELALITHLLEQVNRSEDFAKELMTLILKKDQKSSDYIKSKDGQKILEMGSKILKELSNDSKSANQIIEARNQHAFFFNAAGGVVKSNNTVWWVIAGLLTAFIIYKIVDINKDRKEIKEIENGTTDSTNAGESAAE